MEKPDCRLTRFLFGLFAITSPMSGATVVPNAWIAQEVKLGHVSRVCRCWNAGIPPEVSAVVIGLEVKPELRTVPEVLREAERGVRGDGALAMHDFIDAARRDADVFGEPVFGEAERLEKFFDKHFAGRDEREQLGFRFRVHFWFGSVQFGNSRRSVVIQNLALS
jgi:hypothetical protein